MIHYINHLTNPFQANEIDQPAQICLSEENGMIKVNKTLAFDPQLKSINKYLQAMMVDKSLDKFRLVKSYKKKKTVVPSNLIKTSNMFECLKEE